MRLLALALCFLPLSAVAQDHAMLDEQRWYRLKNLGYNRLNQDMCVDINNGGPLNNQLDSRPCANYSGQFWHFRGVSTAFRDLPTYIMTTMFRGDEMCLTLDGTLVDHELKLAPCTDPQSMNQIFAVTRENGKWTIEPMLSVDNENLNISSMYLVVSTPPEGDGVPHINGRDYMGQGGYWNIQAE